MTSVQIGQRVYWYDPGDGLASGNGTVVSIGVDDGEPIVPDETVIALKMDDGGEAEVLLQELDVEHTWAIKAITYPQGGGVLVTDLAPPVPAATDAEDAFDVLTDTVIAQAEQLVAEGALAHADLVVVVAENWNRRADGKAVGLLWTSRDGYVGDGD